MEEFLSRGGFLMQKLEWLQSIQYNILGGTMISTLTWEGGEEVQERVEVLGEELLGHVGGVEVALEVGVLLVDLLLERHAVGEAAGVELGQLPDREDDLLVAQLVLEPVARREALRGQVLYHKNLKEREGEMKDDQGKIFEVGLGAILK